jgi:hypothetical protein
MKKIHNIKNINFEDDFIILTVDNQIIKLDLSGVSDRLAKATKEERETYRISPSGYGIHWTMIDEDLSVNGLLEAAKSTSALQAV